MDADALARARDAVEAAQALVITAGAGMGVDSGLPDFRGREGFWRAYPAFEAAGLDFQSLANPRWFEADPELAWGFYGHRLELYRRTRPHQGFTLLLETARRKPHGAFVVTSNVDGQFQKAGFDEQVVVEVHGTIHHAQCLGGCAGAFPMPPGAMEVDAATVRARPPLPACPRCGALARPNILMFGDSGWDDARTEAQHRRFSRWLRGRSGPVVVIELGAGLSVPTIRLASERLVRGVGATLVRVNPREPEVPRGQIGLRAGALEALTGIL